MESSVRYYVDGLGFVMKHKWDPGGKLRWCWLTLGSASIMLQAGRVLESNSDNGVSFHFQCEDALAIYREMTTRGVAASEPQVSNGLWETLLRDPDGYRIFFDSPTDVPEETKLSEV